MMTSITAKQGTTANPRSRPKRKAASVQRAARTTHPVMLQLTDFLGIFKSTPDVRVKAIKRGVPANEVKRVARLMNAPNDVFYQCLNLPRATVERKASQEDVLSTEKSERAIGMSSLVGQVQAMVEESGNPEGFDAAKWVWQWLNQPVPALGGKRPVEYMDTMEGQKLVSNLLTMMQTGAYA
jgi:putative toxin-antitoxin system antitoxin component (TIGR02293 family)